MSPWRRRSVRLAQPPEARPELLIIDGHLAVEHVRADNLMITAATPANRLDLVGRGADAGQGVPRLPSSA
jgi:hypothetical protein